MKPILVVMAAGLGSRYGGLKQIDPVGTQGELIIDFSIFDAIKAGFEKVVFIIKKQIEADFKAGIGNRIQQHIQVEYVYQELDVLPEGFTRPAERLKPWGTAHAVLCAKSVIDGPFVVINADDFYGEKAFQLMYNFLSSNQENHKFAMVGFELGNTVTDHGHVARGICLTDEDHQLITIQEHTHIEIKESSIISIQKDKHILFDGKTTVSMNFWGFKKSIFETLENSFGPFLEKGLLEDPLTCEYFLPNVIDQMIRQNEVAVVVLKTPDQWYGVTYKEDKPIIANAIKELQLLGHYPEKLWGNFVCQN